MKAWVLHDVEQLVYEEVESPVVSENEVLVAVKAVGICGSDIPRIYKDGAHTMPLIIGHEFSGEVVQCGEKVNSAWKGKRVGIFPLIPCKECNPCNKKMYEMCRHYDYLGSRRNGGFAEYVSVPEWNLIELPDKVSFEQAAMLEPMAVAVHAMRRALPDKIDTVVVCGLGTIGMLLTMFLKECGIEKILTIGNKDFQKKMVMSLGVPEQQYCDDKSEDILEWIWKRTGGNGADVFFECVGKTTTYSQAVNLTAPAGKICLVGNPYTDMSLDKNVYWKILRNQLHVIGTWNSSFNHELKDDWHYVLTRLQQGRVHPEDLISHRYPLEKLHSGIEIMKNKSEDYIKIMAKADYGTATELLKSE